MQDIARVLCGLNQEVQGEDPHSSGDKPPPEDGGAVEGCTFLYCEQQAADWSCKSSGHTCPASITHQY